MAPLMSRFFVGAVFLSTATFGLQIGEEVGDEQPGFVPGYGGPGYGYGGVYGRGGYGGYGPYGNGYAGGVVPAGYGGVGPYGNAGFNGPAVHTVVHHPRPAQAVTHVYHSLNEEKHDMPQPAGAGTKDAELTDAPAPVESMEAPLDARAGEELADEQPGWGRGYGVGGYGYGVGGYGYGGVGPYGNGVGPYGNAGFNGPAVHTVVHHPRPAQAVTHVYHSLNEEKPKMPPAAGADFDDAESTDAPAPMESTEAPLDARASEELAEEQPGFGRGYGVGGYGVGGYGYGRGYAGGAVRAGYGGVGPYAVGGFNRPAAHTVVHHPRPAQAVTHVYHSLNEDKPKMPPAAGADFDDAESTEVPLDARASEELADEQPGFVRGRAFGPGHVGLGYGGVGMPVHGGVPVRGGYGGFGPHGNGVGPIAHGPVAAHTVVHHPRPAQAVTHVYHSRNEDDDE